MLARARHRLKQFSGALRPHVDERERADAYTWLSPEQRRLFETMTLRDRQHGIEVYRRVKSEAAADDADLFVAALLHDCGKGRVTLWQRVAHVVMGAVAPGWRGRLASEGGAEWRRAFWRLLHHPELGAEMAARAGANPDTVRMIRMQESADGDARLAALQAADEA